MVHLGLLIDETNHYCLDALTYSMSGAYILSTSYVHFQNQCLSKYLGNLCALLQQVLIKLKEEILYFPIKMSKMSILVIIKMLLAEIGKLVLEPF